MSLRKKYLALTVSFALGIFYSLPILSDIILDPDPTATLNVTVGLTGESFSHGSAFSFSSGTQTFSQGFTSDGQFSIKAGASGNPYTLNIYMYNFQGLPNSQLRHYIYNQPALVANDVVTLDLTRASGRISSSVTVNGATLSRLQINTVSSDISIPELFYGQVIATTSPFNAVLAVPPLTTNVSGTATVTLPEGCDASIPLSTKSVAVTAGGVHPVNWTIDATSLECSLGDLTVNVPVSGLENLNADAIESRKLIQVSGPQFASNNLFNGETTTTFTGLKIGEYYVYNYNYYQEPYSYFRLSQNGNRATVSKDTTTIYDRSTSVATFHQPFTLEGAWDSDDLSFHRAYMTFSDASKSGFSYDLNATSGLFDFVVPTGAASIYNYQFGSIGTNAEGVFESWNAQSNLHGDRETVTLLEGDRVTAAGKTFETSQGSQLFLVAQQAGQPEATINRLVINGYSNILSDTGSLLARNYITSDTRPPALSEHSVLLRGFPGTYALNATGYGTDGRQYRASFELTLLPPGFTEVGTNIEEVFTSDTGESIGTLTFDNVTVAGETTLSQTSLGPSAPPNFKVFGTGTGQAQYFDVTTTATFDGSVKICFNYDESKLSSPDKENTLTLHHYIESTSTWEDITTSLDTAGNVICGTTDSFSFFALMELDIIDTDLDGIQDDLDNCPNTSNTDQSDFDGDGIGDACDFDADGDSIPDDSDLCPGLNSTNNNDLDGDGIGDPCDSDVDGDEQNNDVDNCPVVANAGQEDFDGDGLGDACDIDIDGDSVINTNDNCPGTELGVAIDNDGCSSEQRIEAFCPSGGVYKNHGRYVSCISNEAEYQVVIGLITDAQKDIIVSNAARSDIGKKK